MLTSVYLDSNVWDFLVERQIDSSAVMPGPIGRIDRTLCACSHADVIRGANFILVMFKLESEVNLCSSSG